MSTDCSCPLYVSPDFSSTSCKVTKEISRIRIVKQDEPTQSLCISILATPGKVYGENAAQSKSPNHSRTIGLLRAAFSTDNGSCRSRKKARRKQPDIKCKVDETAANFRRFSAYSKALDAPSAAKTNLYRSRVEDWRTALLSRTRKSAFHNFSRRKFPSKHVEAYLHSLLMSSRYREPNRI